jgi:hypothetical protein
LEHHAIQNVHCLQVVVVGVECKPPKTKSLEILGDQIVEAAEHNVFFQVRNPTVPLSVVNIFEQEALTINYLAGS